MPLDDWFPLGKREAIRRRHMKQARGCGTPFCASQPFIRGAYADANGLTGSQGFWGVGRSVCWWKCKSRATQIIGDKLGLETRGLTAYGCSRGRGKLRTPGPDCFGAAKGLFAGRLTTNHGHAHYDSPDAAWRSDVNKSICCGLPRVVLYGQYMRACRWMTKKKRRR